MLFHSLRGLGVRRADSSCGWLVELFCAKEHFGMCVAILVAAMLTVCSVGLAPCLAEVPAGEDMVVLVSVAPERTTVGQLIDMDADLFGRDETGRVLFRVSDSMLAELDEESIEYRVVHENIYTAYDQWRSTLGLRRDESFAEYHDLHQAEKMMHRLAREYPGLAVMEVIGKSVEGRHILALRISDSAYSVQVDRPGMLVVGCHHAREWISVEVPLYLAERLLLDYGKVSEVTRLLRYGEVWIVPVLNPDGLEYTKIDRWWRKNRRDNTDGTMGVDLNRNYSIGFGGEGSSDDPSSYTFHGSAPFSEPETDAIRGLISGEYEREFDAVISYHSYSQLVLYPNAHVSDPVENDDEYAEMAGEMARRINATHENPEFDYEAGQAGDSLYLAGGDLGDWAHHVGGAMAVTIELRPRSWPYFELSADQIVATCEENLPAMLYMAEYTMLPDLSESDIDSDGVMDSDDYCQHSDSAEVDSMGCTAAEADLDEDGVLNTSDLCAGSLPNQQVDEDGCRVDAMLTVEVRSNISSLDFVVDPSDIDAVGFGQASPRGFDLEYAEEVAVSLTAPAISGGSDFLYWIVGGEKMPVGQKEISFVASDDISVAAIYRYPKRVEILGDDRVPDRRGDGGANMVRLRAEVLYSDDTSRLVDDDDVVWQLSEDNHGVVVDGKELLLYDVSAEEEEVTVSVTAVVTLGGQVIESQVWSLVVYDAETVSPKLREFHVEGPDFLGSEEQARMRAMVRLDGEFVSLNRSDEVVWHADFTETHVDGSSMEDSSFMPVTISDSGVVTADVVSEDVDVLISATFTDGYGEDFVVDKVLTIEADKAAGDPTDSIGRGIPAGNGSMCGAAGTVGLLGSLIGLVPLGCRRR